MKTELNYPFKPFTLLTDDALEIGMERGMDYELISNCTRNIFTYSQKINFDEYKVTIYK